MATATVETVSISSSDATNSAAAIKSALETLGVAGNLVVKIQKGDVVFLAKIVV